MIKNIIKTTVVSVLLLSSSLVAGNIPNTDMGRSLLGIEGGYNTLSSEVTATSGTTTSFNEQSQKAYNLGLKMGSQNEHLRVFISGRYFVNSEYDNFYTYGGEMQYMFNVFSRLNVFMGASYGRANLKFTASGETFSRNVETGYRGGDIGANIHVSDSLDLELGGRIISLEATNLNNSTTYKFNDIKSVYGSLIFKWQSN